MLSEILEALTGKKIHLTIHLEDRGAVATVAPPKAQPKPKTSQKKSSGGLWRGDETRDELVASLKDGERILEVIDKVIAKHLRAGGPKKYSAKKMRMAMIDLAVIGVPVSSVKKTYGVPDGTLYNWRKKLLRAFKSHRVKHNVYQQRAA